ncbi:RIP metalloprotease RseP [Neisseria canis]|uniref:Zinc metalloprotease n=1 Tax=Neisseria canis TaxID=493 RepID=A0A1X3CY89_9NEIS|nr:RIP metalloprotease RseP [Neisseria canis]OSI12424.1 RIP metalloprotease RseP [Neisseria canis]VEE99035.1 integral membrane protein [Neisseria canis]
MLTIIAFLAAILLLVSLHEFGHYFVARRCGVKVLRFSVGFGKPFYTKKIGDTEWCLAPIPLGGYVKMVDSREGHVAEKDLPYAFDQQHPAKRIAIVAAGPITNLLLAVLLFGLSFSFGVTEIKPFIGTVEKHSIADKAGFREGDLILSVNGETVKDWADARTKITLNLDAGKVDIQVVDNQNQPALRQIDIAGTPEASLVAKRNGYIGLDAAKRSNLIGKIKENSPADKAGLKKGDLIVSVDGKMTPSWQDWSAIVQNSPGQKLMLGVVRNGQNLQIAIRPDSQETRNRNRLVGFIGVSSDIDKAWEEKISRKYTPSVSQAFKMGWDKTVEFSTLTAKFFGKLLTGQASINHISGPLTIADVAGKTAAISMQAYLEFLALVSVSLGVLNFMPVPVLDGGHLVFYTLEWLRGKPLSERVQMMGIRIGITAMLMLMLLAFFNDITRLFG